MGKTIGKGVTFGVNETVTNTKLHNLVDNATITKVTDTDNDTGIDTELTSDVDELNLRCAGTVQVKVTDGTIEPITDDDIDLGSSGKEFKDLHVDGVANIDSLVADTADINAGTVDATVGGTTPAAGTFTTLIGTNVDGIIGANTPAAGTFTTVDINAGTVDATIGATTPAAGTFTDIIATTAQITGTAPSPPAVNTIYKDNVVKAWINFNGTGTIAIRDSFNVSSITDSGGTGDYIVTWDRDFADSNYSCSTGGGITRVASIRVNAIAAGSIDIIVVDHTNTASDETLVMIQAIGNQ